MAYVCGAASTLCIRKVHSQLCKVKLQLVLNDMKVDLVRALVV